MSTLRSILSSVSASVSSLVVETWISVTTLEENILDMALASVDSMLSLVVLFFGMVGK